MVLELDRPHCSPGMNSAASFTTRRSLLVLVPLLILVVAACGGNDDDDRGEGTTGTTRPGPRVTIASFGFGESEILANIYGKALEAEDINVSYKLRLGTREVVAPALEKGEVDLVPEYVGNLLAFFDPTASAPGDDLATTTAKLRERASAKKLTVLEPSAAANGDIIAMTRVKAAELGVTKISDLTGKESSLVMGGPPECAQRITCYKGLQDVYGLRFDEFKPLDTGGPITVESLKEGEVHVARLFSSDPAIRANDFVVLEDDKFIQPSGNVVPVIRDAALTDEIARILNRVSAELTTEELIELNTRVDVRNEDAATVAEEWLEANL